MIQINIAPMPSLIKQITHDVIVYTVPTLARNLCPNDTFQHLYHLLYLLLILSTIKYFQFLDNTFNHCSVSCKMHTIVICQNVRRCT